MWEWGIKPLYIREGGSIPAVSWLEKRFNAATIHLPIGQVNIPTIKCFSLFTINQYQ